jgi:Tol biopolymer transport system component
MLKKIFFQLIATSIVLTGCVGNVEVTKTATEVSVTPTALAVGSVATETAISPQLPKVQYLAFGLNTPSSELIRGTLPVSCLTQGQICDQQIKVLHTGIQNRILGSATWSPDGKQLAFVAGSDRESFDVYVMDSTGSTPINLTNSLEPEFEVAWSPDGKTIAFSREVTVEQDGQLPIRHSELWLMQSDGSNPRKIGEGCCMQWLPHNERLVYRVFDETSGLSDLWVTDRNGTELHNLTNSPLREQEMTLSPDGHFIVYSAFDLDTQQTHLYLLDREMSVTVALVPDMNSAEEATFSPDGSHLAFIADSGQYEKHLYVMNVDQTGLIDLSELSGKPATANAMDTDPLWVSDSQLVFISTRTKVAALYVINSDGTGVREVLDPTLVMPGSGIGALSRWP